jgi:hypothetical protein
MPVAEPRFIRNLAEDLYLCVSPRGIGNDGLRPIQGPGGMHRPHGHRCVQAIADDDIVDSPGESIEEFALDGFGHIDALDRHAHLTRHAVHRFCHALHCGIAGSASSTNRGRCRELERNAFDCLRGIGHDLSRSGILPVKATLSGGMRWGVSPISAATRSPIDYTGRKQGDHLDCADERRGQVSGGFNTTVFPASKAGII